MSQLVSRTRKYERANLTVVSAFRRQLAKTPDKPIYLFGESVWNMNDVSISYIVSDFSSTHYNCMHLSF